MSDDEKKAWQEQQAALDAQALKQREKDEKARARKARKAKHKVERLKRELSKSGDLTDWEDEFAGSISERLTEYDSAFRDPEKGRSDEALSYAQKAIVSQLSKKAKKAKSGEVELGGFKPRSSFKSKKPKWTPCVRQLDEEFEAEAPPKPQAPNPHSDSPTRPPVGKPFLRIVKDDEG